MSEEDVESLYFVRAAMSAARVPEVVGQLEADGLAVRNAYHIFVGVPAPDRGSSPVDGIELVINAADIDHNRFATLLTRIIPGATFYVGHELKEAKPVVTSPSGNNA